MLKIDSREFKDINYDTKFLIEDSNKYDMEFNQNVQMYMINMFKTYSQNKDAWSQMEKELYSPNNCLNDKERFNVLMMVLNLRRFMISKININKHITIDEMNEKYRLLNNNGGLSPFFAKLLEIYIQEKNNIINTVLEQQKQGKLDEYLDTQSLDEKNEIKILMGFEKIPVYIHPTDFSNFAQVNEKYMYQLSDEELQIDLSIDKSIEKEKRTKENVEGTTMYERILDEVYSFYKFDKYALGLMFYETESKFDEYFDKRLDEIKSGEKNNTLPNYNKVAREAKENLERLQTLTENF